jgi:hypothetical protein
MDGPTHRPAQERQKEHPPPRSQYSVKSIHRGKRLIHFAHYTFKKSERFLRGGRKRSDFSELNTCLLPGYKIDQNQVLFTIANRIEGKRIAQGFSIQVKQ